MDSSNSVGDSDLLSELPDSLILEILSLLPMNDVVSTILLSKRWLHLWTTVPCLDFKYKYKSKNKEFVSGALAHWKGSKIHKFSLRFDLESVDMVDSWLAFAIEKQVEELLLLYYYGTHCLTEYCPPQRLYSCSSLTKMSLSFCDLRIDEAVQWNRLKSLEIDSAVSLSEDAMNRILAGAPLLEELILVYYRSIENLNIRSISLKILKLNIYSYEQVLRVWAPNLLDLEISGYFYGTCFLDVLSLINAKICFNESWNPGNEMFHQVLRSIRHVEKLTLSKFSIKTLLRMKPGFKFPNAKSLSFDADCAEEMLRVVDMFPNLTTLCVQQKSIFLCKTIDSHLSKADLPSPLLPFLKRVEITWYAGDVSIIPALEILLENAKLLDKMVFTANWPYVERGDKKPEVLLSESASSPTAEVTIVHGRVW